jgi:hypothetical protein
LNNAGNTAEDHVKQLKALQDQLEVVAKFQGMAADAYAQSSAAAQSAVYSQQQESVKKIEAWKAQQDGLNELISLEQAHIGALILQKDAVQSLMEAMGVERLSEIDTIDKTIRSLVDRGKALENERNGLLAITGASAQATGAFAALAAQMANAAAVQVAVNQAPDYQSPGGGSGGGLGGAPSPYQGAFDNFRSAGGSGTLADFLKSVGVDIPQYAMGTDYVPRTGVALVHQGEAVTTSGERSNQTALLQQMCKYLAILCSRDPSLKINGKEFLRAIAPDMRAMSKNDNMTFITKK